MPLAEAKATMVGPRRWSDVLYLHLSSYFLAFRRPVIDDPGFRRRLDAVSPQTDKMSVVHKYEVGISRYLMDSGFEFDTLLTDLYPFHPLYSRRFFELAARGFPLVKRNFLAENPRRVADFGQWENWLLEAVPEAPMAAILASIDRVSPQDVRALSTLVQVDERGRKVAPGRPLAGYGFRSMSREAPKFDHWWAFPVDRLTHQLPTGSRAVWEAVRDDPSIRKVVLTRSRRVELDGPNVVVLPLGSRDGTEELARCGQVLLDGHPRASARGADALRLAPFRPRGRRPADRAAATRARRAGGRVPTGGACRGVARGGAGPGRRLATGRTRSPVAHRPSPPRPRRPPDAAERPGP